MVRPCGQLARPCDPMARGPGPSGQALWLEGHGLVARPCGQGQGQHQGPVARARSGPEPGQGPDTAVSMVVIC